MTIEQFLNMPKNITIQEYELQLKKEEAARRKMMYLSLKIEECEDALDVLSDEVGSDRWKKWSDKLAKYKAKMEAMAKL